MPRSDSLCGHGGFGAKYQLLSDYGHVAHQIKGNQAYNNMLASMLPLHIPWDPRVGSKCHFLISKSSYVACRINGNAA